jgi:prevent-host-death family protein
MITVGIRELRNRLSHYLRRVKGGDAVTITDRGESIALLLPSSQNAAAISADALSRKGIGAWKGGKPKGASRRVRITGKRLSEIVIEERR